MNEENIKSIKDLMRVKRRMERFGVKVSSPREERQMIRLIKESAQIFQESDNRLMRLPTIIQPNSPETPGLQSKMSRSPMLRNQNSFATSNLAHSLLDDKYRPN